MTPYRKITSNIAGKLNLLETYLFYCLALCSDCYTLESHTKQENLANFYGIKKTDQIREWLHKFESLGLIQIDKTDIYGQYGKFNRCSYQLDTEHYVLISNKLYDEPISRELKGFLILLKCKCLNGTNTTLYSQNKLAEELGLAKGTVSKYINEAEEKGYVKRDRKEIHLLREDIFLITSESQLAIIKNIYPEIITDEDLERGYIV
ncbi:helix-turn-helix domain-containing protein [Bacteroides sp. GD17]|jgi:DNA-binding MarR family transcriptional regulator|uniref:helix-turn-helix domain-containing protein n=1 Tax=Bacteroides sp. GD17 TaxID=3139826 RepID=UPI00313DC6DE